MKRAMIRTTMLAGLGCVALLAGSCAPTEARRAAEARRVVAEARPLLRRLGVEAPDLSRLAEEVVVTARVPSAPPPFVAGVQSAGDAARALDCLTAAVYHEARSEHADGQRAVAQVVLNRVRDRAFPASVCGVVYQGSHRATGCQFSFTCDGSLRRPREPNAWARAEAVARAALAGAVYAPVGSATHYHAGYVSPWWAPSLARIGAVGSHIFYRWRSALERVLTFRQAYAGWEPGAAPAFRSAVAATEQAAAPEFGVGEAAGVRVHRFGAEAAPISQAVPMRRAAVSMGVRIHRGTGGGDAAGAVLIVDGAIIGAESDPV